MDFNITGKQREVLKFRSEGVNNKEIAAKLNISQHAILSRIRILCRALNARDISHAISLGIEHGIIGEQYEQYAAIQEINEKVNKLGLTEIAEAYLMDRFGLNVISQKHSPRQLGEYIDYMTALIDQVEQPNGVVFS
ncbi:MAG: hypothetical protein JKX91_06700 [Rhizobiaceae bacterium]|nr:hypothetical protein [Rhizobiaceae bacterium]